VLPLHDIGPALVRLVNGSSEIGKGCA